MTQQLIEDPLTAARQAVDRHAWNEAYELLAGLDAEGRLDGPGLELLGSVAWWAGRPDVSTEARERAFSAYLEEGDRPRAAFMALLAARDHAAHLSSAVAQGWRARAERILKHEPESFAHGYLELVTASWALGREDIEGAAERAARAVEIGARFGDRDLQAYGLVYHGMALVKRGDIEDGLALIDEAAAAAVSGELSAFATGVVYCNTISTCRDLADYRRAGEWAEVAKRWCERQAISGFPGVCRVHSAEILAIRGSWQTAEEEARLASEELLTYKALAPAADGFYAIGEIRLHMGDVTGAEEAFRQARELGHEGQPGIALLHHARGRTEAALVSIGTALATGSDRLRRARLLPAAVTIALEANDVETASGAAEELSSIAESYSSPALHAAAHESRGAVLVVRGEAAEGIRELARAQTHWQEIEAPYEVARTRVWLGRAHKLLGNAEDAVFEFDIARSTFERLGAHLDASRATQLLREVRESVGRAGRVRRTFVFTDIVGSTELIGLIGDDAWEDLRRWHDQTIRRLVGQHGGEEVNHAGDGFFLAFREARVAVRCAVAIQRALAEHRRGPGFAPHVRIGVHAAEASRGEDGYLGRGVHEAARIGAIAGGDEILVSAEALGEGVDEPVGEARSVELKGIEGRVEVHAVRWSG